MNQLVNEPSSPQVDSLGVLNLQGNLATAVALGIPLIVCYFQLEEDIVSVRTLRQTKIKNVAACLVALQHSDGGKGGGKGGGVAPGANGGGVLRAPASATGPL